MLILMEVCWNAQCAIVVLSLVRVPKLTLVHRRKHQQWARALELDQGAMEKGGQVLIHIFFTPRGWCIFVFFWIGSQLIGQLGTQLFHCRVCFVILSATGST